MKYYFVRIGREGQVKGDKFLFKFEDIQKALNFMWMLRETVFTEHVEITLLNEEDI